MNQFFPPKYPTCQGFVRVGATVVVQGATATWPADGFDADRRYSFVDLGNGSFEIKRSRLKDKLPQVIVRSDDVELSDEPWRR